MGIGLGGQSPPRCGAGAAMLGDIPDHAGVIIGIGDNGDEIMILGGGADHGRAADIDILHQIITAGIRPRQGGGKGVEVDNHQINRADPASLHISAVAGIVTAGQNPAMDRRMQGLDAAIHHLGGTRDIRNRGHVNALIRQQPGRPAG